MTELPELLRLASEGERSSVLRFLACFRGSLVIVPQKNQSPVFTGLPPYPNRPLDVLAVRDGDNITVPIFTEVQLVEAWAARQLSTRQMKVLDLIALLPEDWWLTLNPGDDVRKDFSPWELKRLLGGEEELNEIATDLELEYGVEPLQIRKLKTNEFTEVKTLLSKLLSENLEIREFYLAVEEGKTIEGSAVETLLLGVKIKEVPVSQAELIRNTVKNSVSPLLIGSLQLRVLLGVGFSDLELGVFADLPPELSNPS